jgi:L-Ala-D/L-Glu epimerase
MRITGIRTTKIGIPYSTDIVSSFRGRQSGVDPVLIEVETDEGLIGLGEVVGTPPYSDVAHLLIDRIIAPLLVGEDPLRIEELLRRMEAVTTKWMASGVYATSAVEIALHDLKGKALGVPVYELLGGRVRDRVPVAGYVFIDEPEVNARQVALYLELGVPGVKVKVGRDADQDEQRLAAIRDVLGPSRILRIDADEAWAAKKAIQCIRRYQQFGLALVEQPVPLRDYEGLALVRRSVDVPVAPDDAIWNLQDAIEHIRRGTSDAFVIRPEEAGGLRNFQAIAALAAAESLGCACGSSGSSGLLLTARLHAVAATSGFAYPTDTHYYFMADDILAGGMLEIREGALDVPTGPGLGIDLDREKVAEYAKRAISATHWGKPDYLPQAPRHFF